MYAIVRVCAFVCVCLRVCSYVHVQFHNGIPNWIKQNWIQNTEKPLIPSEFLTSVFVRITAFAFLLRSSAYKYSGTIRWRHSRPSVVKSVFWSLCTLISMLLFTYVHVIHIHPHIIITNRSRETSDRCDSCIIECSSHPTRNRINSSLSLSFTRSKRLLVAFMQHRQNQKKDYFECLPVCLTGYDKVSALAATCSVQR